MVNIEFLVICYFISLFVDWIFQWEWQAINKSKWTNKNNLKLSFIAVTTHSLIYALISTITTLYLIQDMSKFWLVFIVLFISHVIIDTRIPVKWIMRFKGISKENINDYQNYGFMHLGIDHRLHEAVILILAIFI